jgi:dipeptidyl aminopeptidase/acylaminoacyl peptidase
MMPKPDDPNSARPHLRRDSQQWIFDYVINQTGLTYHWWSDEKRSLPDAVRSHAMISKHLGRRAIDRESVAAKLAASGDDASALKAYFAASKDYLKAQHPIFERNAEKAFLYDGLIRCYQRVCELSPYRIERIEVPFEGSVVAGWLHLLPGVINAPLLFYVPGCDTTCEASPDPTDPEEHRRGYSVFSFDGPGLGQSTMRGIALTADNFERAASAALDVLIERPEIDAHRVVAYGGGAGSFWALRFAAHDHRLRAVATKSTYADKYYLMNEDSPRYKQLFAFLTQAADEDDLDRILADMTLDGYLDRIQCPTLMLSGEYDLRDPIEEVFGLFDQLTAPAELWVFADQFHKMRFAGGVSVYDSMLDWLSDRLDDVPLNTPNVVRYIEPEASGPAGPGVRLQRRWYEGENGTGPMSQGLIS